MHDLGALLMTFVNVMYAVRMPPLGHATLKNVRYIVDREGRRAAVQLSIEDWQALLDYLESIEDRVLVKSALARLRQGPEEAKALPWDEARAQW